jgi:hypothetical protein
LNLKELDWFSDSSLDNAIYCYDKSKLKRIHNIDTGEEMLVYRNETRTSI